ncbi:MAG: NAD-glutamate dehydrogenase [Gammaproteobacteria bacterium]|nr:NAD-glutamate dehydrogenase [Gammaproteobacteria bacterium]
MPGSIPAARRELIDRIAARARRSATPRLPVAAARFTRLFYRGVSELDLAARNATDLAGAALSLLAFGLRRRAGRPLLRVFNPEPRRDGFHSPHTVIALITDDMPFLVDSLGIVCTQAGLAVRLLAHPVLSVTRDRRGRLRGVYLDDAPRGARAESWQFIEVEREPDPERRAALEQRLRATLADVRRATRDWRRMRARALALATEFGTPPRGVPAREASETRALLEWMEDNHFTLLGYREYRLRRGRGHDRLEAVPATGLGLLRSGQRRRHAVLLRGEVRDFARAPEPLIITKANSVSTVHRATYLDYVGVKSFDAAGRVTGERRFIGLWTSSAYSQSPHAIPVLRHKVQRVIARFGPLASSHDSKAVAHVIEAFPRDELFQASVADLARMVRGIVNLYERAQVRLFVRRDVFGRFQSCLIYVPRDRYNTQVRERIERLALEAFGGQAVESQVQLSESVLARVHLLVRTPPGARQRLDVAELEQCIRATVRTWQDHLRDHVLAERDEVSARRLLRAWGAAFPAAYQEDTAAAAALADIGYLETLASSADGLHLHLYRRPEQPRHKIQLKLYRRERPIPISDVLPTIENLGLRLISERPYAVAAPAGRFWIQDFELEHPRGVHIELASDGPRLRATLTHVWLGDADNDGFNRLVLAADLDWREVTVLRGYARWFVQLGLPLSQASMEEALASNAAAASALLRLFRARFDPIADRAGARRAAGRERRRFARLLARVVRGDDDRILRAFHAAIEATVRTNWFQGAAGGARRPALALKLEPRRIAEVPRPRPMFEIFVHAPRFEGVHLRMGRVARGGIRWSDRREDFRTEILGLMKAQNVKNTVIVPVGAKGGFVPRRLPAGRDEAQREGTECYRGFIRALLDVTDNVVAGRVVPPPDVLRHDGDDPYLVVAADKGTATFSDTANAIAAEYGFWLGDAFASGGSAGYDHKQMAITARGAWESVQRHFRELGVDLRNTDFTVAGIGDMSGDVFGNGLLLSPHIRLLAAFNHQHIFLDPDPDAAASYAERRRLFRLPRSGWDDYDRRRLSPGGGVYPRQGKSVPLSPQARALLGVEAASLAPNEVIRAILRLPVDLLWNGGIGTYVRGSDESEAAIGDRSNDAVRITGRELRCRVLGEGGNLGVSQRGRIEYAERGGRLNTDFIDNSGGVNCSDVEVNLKILLNPLVTAGALSRPARDRLLERMTAAVAGLVLRNNYLQNLAISTLQARAAERIAELGHVIRALERSVGLDRALEALPTDEELVERHRAGLGLTRPELAMLLSYSKIWLYEQLISSDVPEDPWLGTELVRYFPPPVQQKFPRQIAAHQLRREIIATAVSNSLVNRMGPVFAIRATEDTGAGIASVARAWAIAREITRMRELWTEIEALDDQVPAARQYDMLFETTRLLRHLSYWVLRNAAAGLDIERTVSRLGPGLRELLRDLPELLDGVEAASFARALERFGGDGVPARVARRVASMGALHSGVDIVEVALARRVPVLSAARAYFGLGTALGLDWIRAEVERLPVEGRWQAIARAALREEAYSLHRRLCDQVLARGLRREPAAVVAAWLADAGAAAEAAGRLIQEMRNVGTADFPTLSVALQAVRRLAER